MSIQNFIEGICITVPESRIMLNEMVLRFWDVSATYHSHKKQIVWKHGPTGRSMHLC